jgi:endogenous inhibitor of DNA gyrase (YacG/DUF329 family)
MTSKAAQCPTCRREVLPRSENPCFPFCSDRCKAIDLGRWLGGEYRIAARSEDEDEDGDAPPAVRPTDT